MNKQRIILRGMIVVLTFTIGVSVYEIWSDITLSDISSEMSWTSEEIEQNCDIYAGLPQLNRTDRIIYGSGVRGTSCTSTANVRVYLKQDRRFWFDRTLASNVGGGTNFEVFVRYNCRGTGSQMVYIEVRSGNKKVQSRRVGVAYCG